MAWMSKEERWAVGEMLELDAALRDRFPERFGWNNPCDPLQNADNDAATCHRPVSETAPRILD